MPSLVGPRKIPELTDNSNVHATNFPGTRGSSQKVKSEEVTDIMFSYCFGKIRNLGRTSKFQGCP